MRRHDRPEANGGRPDREHLPRLRIGGRDGSVVAALWIGLLASACTGGGGQTVVDTAGADEGLCGNGVLDPNEDCDGEDDCTPGCRINVCGDGFVMQTEDCDPGDAPDADICNAECELGPSAVVDLAMGGSHSCALSRDGRVRCWGSGNDGRLGHKDTVESIGDDEVPSAWDPVELPEIAELDAGEEHTCARTTDGRVFCWGNNNTSYRLGYGHGQVVGDDESPLEAGPIAVLDAAGIAAGEFHTCVLSGDGDVSCWGSNGEGQLGYGDTVTTAEGELAGHRGKVALPGVAAQIVAGSRHTCARMTSGDVACWGSNEFGQLGTGTPSNVGDQQVPASVGTIDLGGPAIDLHTSTNTTCALLESGEVRCWGDNDSGQVGNGEEADVGKRDTPAEGGVVALEGQMVDVVAGRWQSCGLERTGIVRCWGGRQWVGFEDAKHPSLPGPSTTLGVSAVALEAGGPRTCAITAAGKVRCWGAGGAASGYPDSSGDIDKPAALGDVEVF